MAATLKRVAELLDALAELQSGHVSIQEDTAARHVIFISFKSRRFVLQLTNLTFFLKGLYLYIGSELSS